MVKNVPLMPAGAAENKQHEQTAAANNEQRMLPEKLPVAMMPPAVQAVPAVKPVHDPFDNGCNNRLF